MGSEGDATVDLKAALTPTDGSGLPVPRLQLVWVDAGQHEGMFLSRCHYLLVLPVSRWDVRNIAGDLCYTAVVMGETRSRSGTKSESLDTPYRDGVHVLHDAMTLGVSAFVSRGEKFRRLERTKPNSEAA